MNKTLVAFTLLIAASLAAITTNVDLSSTLSSSVGIQMYGTTSDNVGKYISNAGDFNKDGIEDFIIGTPVSKAYLVFGTSTARTAALDLSSGSNAATSVLKFSFTSTGSKITATENIIVSAAGDMDKDGYDDIAFGIPGWIGGGSTAGVGMALVYYGVSSSAVTTLASVSIDVDNGATVSQTKYFVIRDGHASTPVASACGTSVASGGDVFRDSNNVDDLIVGGPTGTGLVFIIKGTTSKRTADVDLNAISTNGVILTGPASSTLGTYVAGVGDVNGDGFPDAVLGAPGGDAAWLIYGQSGLATATLATTGTSSGMLYNYFTGTASTQFGQNVGACGDINNDGANDFFIGAPKAGSNNGKIYIVSGIKTSAQISDVTTALQLAALTIISGPTTGYLGWRSDGNIDINNDDVDDLIACAPGADMSVASPTLTAITGKCYVMYGKTSFPAVDLSSTTLSTTSSPVGFTITGVATYGFGTDVSVVGDASGDAGDDFIISSPKATGGGIATAGNVHLFYGVAPTTTTGSGFKLGASLLVFVSFIAALMF